MYQSEKVKIIKKNVLYPLLLVCLLFSCKKENALDCFKSNGDDITEIRQTGPFHTIKVSNKIDIEIFPGSDYRVEVVCGKHIIKNIVTKVTSGELNIENNNTCNFVRGYKKTVRVIITVPHIKLVFNDGVGTVRFADAFIQDTLVVKAGNSGDIYVNGSFNEVRTSSHGNGDMYLNGTANSLFVYSNGTNFLNARDLKVKNYIFIETLSIGDCFIDASAVSKFEYNIWRSGNIYYTGQPGEINDFSSHGGKGRAIRE